MKTLTKHWLAVLCAILVLAVLLTPGAFADEEVSEEDEPTLLSCTEIPLYADGEYIGDGYLMDTTTYVPLRTFVETMLQDHCEVIWDQESGTAVLDSGALVIRMTLDDGYLEANGRYIYLQDRVYNINGTILVPIRELAKVFHVGVTWDMDEWSVHIDTAQLQLLESGDTFYNTDDLYWLSHVIFSEAGNQPLEGMIGVGNVVLNRAADESGVFGKGIKGVIFLQGQFDVVAAGAIYMEPSEQAVVAAKLSLEGYNTVGSAKWFVNPAIGSVQWFKNHKTFVLTIADHDFYA